MPKFLVFDESWLEEGWIMYDTPIDPIEAESMEDLVNKIKESQFDGLIGFDVTELQITNETELMLTYLKPFGITGVFYFIEEHEAKERTLPENMSQPDCSYVMAKMIDNGNETNV